MPRARDPNRDKAFEIFKEHNGDITNRKIAEMLDCPEKTISAWKSRDKWNVVLQINECSTANKTTNKKQKNKSKKKATEIEEVPLNENGELTDKQWLFCMYYTKYWNATKAYQKVYECDYATAMVNGSKSLRNTKIRDEISRIKKEIADGIMIESRAVLQKWIDIAFADITDFVTFGKREQQVIGMYGPLVDKKTKKPINETVNYVDLKESTKVDGTIVTEIKQGRDGISVKLADKMKALDFLAKYTDLLNDNELKQLKVEKERIAISKLSGDNSNSQESEIAKMLRKMAGDE